MSATADTPDPINPKGLYAMSAFKDSTGHEWQIEITVGSLSKVKNETGLNLAIASKDAAWLEAVYGDPAKFAEILWSLCERQAKDANVSPEEFANRLTGPVIEAASEQLVVSVCDFFPRSAVAKAIRERFKKILTEADAKAVATIESLLTDSRPPSNAAES
jgi:hypothetical protein